MFLSKKHNYQLKLINLCFGIKPQFALRAGIEALIDGEYKKLADMVIWCKLPRGYVLHIFQNQKS